MSDAYMQYEDSDNMIMARWWGGAYIEFGHVDSDGDWHAHDVINVYDYAKGEARIPFTTEAMTECIEEHLSEDEEEDEEEDMCEACGEPRQDDPDFCDDCIVEMASKREEE